MNHKYHAISGTSIGGINSILIMNDDTQLAEKLWLEKRKFRFSFSGLLKHLSLFSILFLPYLATLIILPGYILWLMSLKYYKTAALYFDILSILRQLLLIFTGFVLYEEETKKSKIFAFKRTDLIFEILISIFILEYFILAIITKYLIFFKTDELLQYSHLVFNVKLISLENNSWWLLSKLASALNWILSKTLFLFIGSLFFGILLLLGSSLSKSMRKLIRNFQINEQLFSNADIFNELKKQINFNDIRKNVEYCFVTIAINLIYKNPFKVNKDGNLADSSEWIPIYKNLKDKTEKEIFNTLKHTSAIPYFFNMGSTSDDKLIADGGLADNIPILPLLEMDLDSIIIICLDEVGRLKFDSIQSLQIYVDNMLEKSTIPYLSEEKLQEIKINYSEQYDPSTHLPKRIEVNKKNVYIISPPRPLPTRNDSWITRKLTGTVDPRLSSRDRWLAQGFKDTYQKKNFYKLT